MDLVSGAAPQHEPSFPPVEEWPGWLALMGWLVLSFGLGMRFGWWLTMAIIGAGIVAAGLLMLAKDAVLTWIVLASSSPANEEGSSKPQPSQRS